MTKAAGPTNVNFVGVVAAFYYSGRATPQMRRVRAWLPDPELGGLVLVPLVEAGFALIPARCFPGFLGFAELDSSSNYSPYTAECRRAFELEQAGLDPMRVEVEA